MVEEAYASCGAFASAVVIAATAVASTAQLTRKIFINNFGEKSTKSQMINCLCHFWWKDISTHTLTSSQLTYTVC